MNLLIFGGTSGIAEHILKNISMNNLIKTNLYATYNNTKKFVKNVNYIKLDLNKDYLFEKKLSNFNNCKFDYIFFTAALTNISSLINKNYCEFGKLKLKYFELLLKVNCYSNLKLFEILHKKKMLKKNSKIIFFSSKAGSTELRGKLKHNKTFGNVFYRISKAALNSAVKNISYDFKNKYQIMALHPGHVKTRSVGKRNADLSALSADYVAKKIIKLIFNRNKTLNGKFLDLHGNIVKW